MNEANPRQMSRSAFERELLGGLLQCKLGLESNMALIQAVCSVLHRHDQDRPIVGFHWRYESNASCFRSLREGISIAGGIRLSRTSA